jgi:Thymidylate synthase
MKQYSGFAEAIKTAKFEIFNNSKLVAPKTWQSVDVTKRPEMVTHEVQWWGFNTNIGRYLDRYGEEDLMTGLAGAIEPNMPWADNHFDERVCGLPLNPGEEWANWPWAKSADKFRKDGMFNHSYAERYWPKFATMLGATENAHDASETYEDIAHNLTPHRGIRYEYGDLGDVVAQLARDDATRSAILPVFFPEDTGSVHGDRVPCSVFYQFMVRDNCLDIFYYLRSCDFVRHFRDDIYLTVRLQLWVREHLRRFGIDVKPGLFLMQTGSLHIFRNDWLPLFGQPYTGDDHVKEN